MSQLYRPATEWELALMVAEAANSGRKLEIVGSGSKRALGRPVAADAVLDMQGIRGIVLYEPSELVMRARAGTRLMDVEKELAGRGQRLAFEPIDTSVLFGGDPRTSTIGAVFATNLSGSRRIASGATRDHLLGLRAVTGQAECISVGGRVLKNVTGYDVSRALAGSYGTLAAITEVTFKVMPVPEATATLLVAGLPDDLAVEALCTGMLQPYEVSGAVHLSAAAARRLTIRGIGGLSGPVTAFRLENLEASVRYRRDRLKDALSHYGDIAILDSEASLAFWDELRRLHHLIAEDRQLWRISVAPKTGPVVVAAIARYMEVEACYDWSGGLVWLLVPSSDDAGVTDIRRVIALYRGHATLVKAAPSVRSGIDVFQPLEPGIARLTINLKHAFDPYRIYNPGRMYATI